MVELLAVAPDDAAGHADNGGVRRHLVQHNGICCNAGVVADGERTLDEAGADLYQLVLDVASGKQTCAEKKGFREISIFKDGVVL